MTVLSRFLHKREGIKGQTSTDVNLKRKPTQAVTSLSRSIQNDMKEAMSDKNYGCSNTILVRIAQAASGYVFIDVHADVLFDFMDIHVCGLLFVLCHFSGLQTLEQGKFITRAIIDGLHQKPQKWRLIYKALTLMEFVLKFGPLDAPDTYRQHVLEIRALKEFYVVEEKVDRGNGIREKTNYILSLLDDENLLLQQREEAQTSRARVLGIGSKGERTGGLEKPEDGVGESKVTPVDNQTVNPAGTQKAEKEDFIKAALHQENELKIQRAEKERNKIKKQRERLARKRRETQEGGSPPHGQTSYPTQEASSHRMEPHKKEEDDYYSERLEEIHHPIKSVQRRSRIAATQAGIRRQNSPMNSTPSHETMEVFSPQASHPQASIQHPQASIQHPQASIQHPQSHRANAGHMPMHRASPSISSNTLPAPVMNQRMQPQGMVMPASQNYAMMRPVMHGQHFPPMQAGFLPNRMPAPPPAMGESNPHSMQGVGVSQQGASGMHGSIQATSRGDFSGGMPRQGPPHGLSNGFPQQQPLPMPGQNPQNSMQSFNAEATAGVGTSTGFTLQDFRVPRPSQNGLGGYSSSYAQTVLGNNMVIEYKNLIRIALYS
ncbi:ENTH domain-containing protein [Cardiosporidium cionae]|uniref:ENTH domain-containing protein n=1 Tax=Cardiosporidium cionae TaxID=476202 RepID=A0ABQ7J838_9APIC|nr:ENTH domain-containing protein [Cardiosporidium cionae]|eukprot:KAF8820141.1 ENTH domain-containing protein [Cardiosporidium cionae]